MTDKTKELIEKVWKYYDDETFGDKRSAVEDCLKFAIQEARKEILEEVEKMIDETDLYDLIKDNAIRFFIKDRIKQRLEKLGEK